MRSHKIEIFSWEDFKQFKVAPKTLAKYCNYLLQERSTGLLLCPKFHDVIRADAGWTKEYMEGFPNKARMIISYEK